MRAAKIYGQNRQRTVARLHNRIATILRRNLPAFIRLIEKDWDEQRELPTFICLFAKNWDETRSCSKPATYVLLELQDDLKGGTITIKRKNKTVQRRL